VTKAVKDPHVQQVTVYRYRCCQCGRTFRHYPEGVTAAHQSQRLMVLAALCWVLGLSLRGTSAIVSVFPVALSHTSIWQDVQAQAATLKRRLPRQVRVLGIDGLYPKLRGREQPVVVAVDLGTGQPVALGALAEKDWRAVVQWLQPLVEELGVEVLVSDDLKELAVAAHRLDLEHQVCQFHVLRWVWRALADLRKQLSEEHHSLVDEVWQLMKERPPDGRVRLFALWQGIAVRRSRDRQTSALYRLRLLILKLMENWAKYTLDQRRSDVPPTNNGTEQAIGKWRIRSHSTRGFKSWAGLEGAFLLCGNERL
jgi:transposase-like protein